LTSGVNYKIAQESNLETLGFLRGREGEKNMAGKEGERSPGKFVIQTVQGEPGSRREGAAGTQLAPLMDPEILKKL
jgi:hypothetical protein